MYTVDIRHNFETAHRLSDPGSPTKCMSIHGHSWWVRVTLAGEGLDEAGILIEFGAFKKAWRGWLDDHLDHHLVLRRGDPMAAAIRGVYPESRILELEHNPTTEVIAKMLFDRAVEILEQVRPPEQHVMVRRVHVQETRVNAAAYEVP